MGFKTAQIGDVPSHWEVAELRAFLDLITYGFTNPMPDAESGPWKLTAKDVIGGRINYATARKTTNEAFEKLLTDKSRPAIGDVLLTKDGSIGRLAVVDRSGTCINQSVALLRPNSRIIPHFLKMMLETPHYQTRMEGDSDGSTIKHIYITRVDKMQVAVPPLKEQESILGILKTLDDKIALLRETNATLEAIAQALFKSWFVDFDPVRAKAEGRDPEGVPPDVADLFPSEFEDSELGAIPKGWRIVRIGELLELAYGKALKATDRTPGEVPVYGSGGINGTHNRALIDHPTVIVGRKGTVGSLYWEDRPCFPIDTVFFVNPMLASLEFCYRLLLAQPLRDMNTDAAVPGLNRENVYRLKVCLPDQSTMDAFDDIVDSLRNRMQAIRDEIEGFASLRDTLLPRLMSGKLRIPDLVVSAPTE